MKSLSLEQIEAQKQLSEWKVGALFMEAGTGKTRVSLELVNASKCDMVLWIGPLHTLQNTKDELSKWGGFCVPSFFFGVESIQQSDRIFFEILDLIQGYSRPFMIVDESLKIKNVNAKRTRRVLMIGKHSEYRLILNGTPISRNLLDMWSQMEFLSPKILNMSFPEFKNTFCAYTTVTKRIGSRSYTKEFITGIENVDYLYSLIRHYVFRCDLKLNVSQCFHDIPYHIGEDERAEYYALKSLFLSDETLAWKNNNVFLEMTQKMQHVYCCSESKFEKLEELFKQISQKDTIIFCKYVKSRDECSRRFPDACVLSYQKESFGLNLQQYRNTVYFDKVWDYALRTQSGHRTYRTGQEQDCNYWDLTGDVGLESLIDRNINKKISISEYFKYCTKQDLEKDL